MRRPVLSCSVAALLVCGVAWAQPEPPKDPVTLRQMFEQQQYQELIREVSRALALRGEAARAYDRRELFTLKAESHLRLKQWSPAAEAFGQASKAATDPKDAAVDRATELIVRRSQNGQFRPKPSGGTGASGGSAARKPAAEPIDIVEPASRKQAIEALMQEELATTTAKVESLKKRNGLKPIADAIELVTAFRPFELAATGADDESKKMLQDLGGAGARLMTQEITRLSGRVDAIEKSAETKTVDLSDNTYTYRGLSGNDRKELNEAMDTSKKIVQAVDELNKVLGEAAGDAFAEIPSDAEKLGTRARQVLNRDYTGRWRGGMKESAR